MIWTVIVSFLLSISWNKQISPSFSSLSLTNCLQPWPSLLYLFLVILISTSHVWVLLGYMRLIVSYPCWRYFLSYAEQNPWLHSENVRLSDNIAFFKKSNNITKRTSCSNPKRISLLYNSIHEMFFYFDFEIRWNKFRTDEFDTKQSNDDSPYCNTFH